MPVFLFAMLPSTTAHRSGGQHPDGAGRNNQRRASLLRPMVAHSVKFNPELVAAILHFRRFSALTRIAISQSFRWMARWARSSFLLFLDPGGRPLRRRGGSATTGCCCIVASFIFRHLCRRNEFRATVLFGFLQRIVAQQLANDVRVQSPHPGAQLVGGELPFDRPLSQGFPRTMEHLGDLFERVVAFLDLHPARLARWAREVKVTSVPRRFRRNGRQPASPQPWAWKRAC